MLLLTQFLMPEIIARYSISVHKRSDARIVLAIIRTIRGAVL